MNAETFALIVGGGPVGLAAAIELHWRAVPTMLVTENLETAQHPKCNNTNARSMEHFRRLGIADELRSEGLPPHIERASAYVTRFCGHEFGRLPRPYSDWPTPEIPNNVPQMVLERALRRCAERSSGAQIHFGWRLNSFAERDDEVVADVENVQTGERQRITSRYLLGIDGASSTVRRVLGFAMIGEDGSTQRAFMGGTMLSFFIRSPTLMAASKRPPTNMTWILNPEMRGMMYAQDGRETWVVHYQVPPRVDLAGDAAHLFTPLGGLGMNTGIGDVMNLCWKLAAVRQGWAGPRLTESYEIERRPMGVRNSQLGVRCTRVMDGWVLPENFEDDSATADAARRAFGAKIMQEDRPQYLTVGIQLGERYETSPIVWPDEDGAPPDTWDTYTPLDRPGARAPHFWLAPGRAAYDEFGEGFTLLDFGAPEGARAFEKAARERRVPLKTLRLEPPRGLYRRKLVLIRPDQHAAWHGDAIADAAAVIDRVRGA